MRPIIALRFRLTDQCGKKLREEASIRRGVSGDIPAKDLVLLPMFDSHNFRSGLRPPLRKQMGDLQPFHTCKATNSAPSSEPSKVKTIRFPFLYDIYKLYGSPFTSDIRIQGRCKNRCEQKIYSTGIHGEPHEILNDPPMSLTPYRDMVIVRQTIGVKPFGMVHIQRRKFSIQHDERKFSSPAIILFIRFFPSVQKPVTLCGYAYRRGAARTARSPHGHPQASVLPRKRLDHTIR